MFTGLVEAKGRVRELGKSEGMTRLSLQIAHSDLLKEPFGASIAVNGCCLTVAKIHDDGFDFDVSRETLDKTSLGALTVGDEVNLERAMQLGDRLGGHLVSGHVDCTAEVVTVQPAEDGWLVEIQLDPSASPLVIPKGSICIDGVSLTVNHLDDNEDGSLIQLMIIPATLQETTIAQFQPGRKVNIELDMVAKFIQRQTHFKRP